jgi:hypothetical protein
MQTLRPADEKLWFAAGMLALEDAATGSYSYFNRYADVCGRMRTYADVC